ncbi:DgyrCDS3985 [Dimorphilus gyrociliatus]|uniref:DgyrCDS3985 n=1 Tax=Dimorphilus gyrociliatus TaxID=2664684 RepID=A0A7I8VK43_9ANNE|nr:DgyrCDS3985 [Dimorphilus gyrociliatus]
MISKQKIIYFLLFYLVKTIDVTFAQDILGCGGFVKSEVKIKFNLINVKLYTKSGGLKYSSDLAPNGYYTIPVYDKGEYLLKVESPPGWTFEPSTVDLNIDGKSDPCSIQKDINFNFVGFGVIGQVISQGQNEGPEGVTIQLKRDNKILQSTKSAVNGKFTFANVLPGSYDIEAVHDRWTFENSKTKVTVTTQTGDAGQKLIVHGYDVTGRVISDGEPVRDVFFLLYSEDGNKLVKHCDHANLERFEKKPICYVISESNGSFKFPALPCGKYNLVPFYKGDLTTYEVQPAKYAFEVKHKTVKIDSPFSVAGFLIKGKVLAGNKGVAAARVILDGKEETLTRNDGTFSIDGIRRGVHVITVMANGMHFDKTTVNVSPTKPELPSIVASKLDVCGDVESSSQREVYVVDKGNKPVTSARVTGAFCIPLAPGEYFIQIRQGADLPQLTPAKYPIKVVDKPMSNIRFTMFLATVKGNVKCLDKCENVQVVLIGEERRLGTVKGNSFELLEVIPGDYKIEIVQDKFCWKQDSVKVKIINENIDNVLFEQTGYRLTITTSHDTKVHITQNDALVKEVQLRTGSNFECVPKKGQYVLRPKSCHQFEQAQYSWDTSSGHGIAFNAVAHLFQGEIRSQSKVSDMEIVIEGGGEGVKIGPIVPKLEAKTYIYSFESWVRKGEELTITPSSATLLFNPREAKHTVQGNSECYGVITKFDGQMGVFKKGFVKPSIEGVNITVTSTDGSVTSWQVTDTKGFFSFGPLQAEKEYEIFAEKEGYVLSKDGDNFKAFKLAEVVITVKGENQEPLDGVLVSLSGDNGYRNNKATGTNGVMNFVGLGPGQYYLRTMKKEYEFDPASRMIQVKEGESVNADIKGNRVAFSVFGKITSLNLTPEPRVTIEAVPTTEICTQEEAQTDEEGKYRIRGLHPNCLYSIQIKKSSNHHIERTSPTSLPVQVKDADLYSIDLIAFRRLNQMDISGRVDAKQKYWSTLSVHLLRDGELITSITPITPFFYTSVPRDDSTEYVLKVVSSLPKSQYNSNPQQLSFIANSSYKHFVLAFHSEMKRGGDHELTSTSLLPLAILIIGVLFYFYPQLMQPAEMKKSLQGVLNRLSSKEVSQENVTGSVRRRNRAAGIN